MLTLTSRGESSAVANCSPIGMPRTTVNRKLAQLKKLRATEQQGARFTVLPEFMNARHLVVGFKRRREVWHRADKKLSGTQI
jgi:DNA-binding IclR family transcriptional regulator